MCTNVHWSFNIVGITFRWFLKGFFVTLIHSFLGFHPFTHCPICPDYPLLHRFFQVLSVDMCPPSALSTPGSTCNRRLNRLSWLLFRRRGSRTPEPPPDHSCGHSVVVHCTLTSTSETFRSASTQDKTTSSGGDTPTSSVHYDSLTATPSHI